MSAALQIGGSIVLATFPAFIWGYIFYMKSPERRRNIWITFIVGGLAVFPILIYKALWPFIPALNINNAVSSYTNDFIGIGSVALIPLSIIIVYMFVGVIEEVMKLVAVRSVDGGRNILDIDDAIEFFIVAALGFSFVENILYFYSIWITHGAGELMLPFFFRSSFSTLAHIIFSGILGYYYGTAYFAHDILKNEICDKRSKITKCLHKLITPKKARVFARERMQEGLLIAIGLHALFNIFLEMGWSILIIPFLFTGYTTLSYLLAKKENHIKYGKLIPAESS
ncbi:hypothetical protein CVV38_01785 [Candidatus Peregrinibacteria bacterium HGW-Peregrinibacteria-1]|jgi:RsiW-degrading membrane proteinase PrsW (M82 family)|nr:MAG: hypothetical protein CVV38_01785 [Candidatus Peregrinibacteria bacterium HGW-Peregrinibacteria-1]